MIANYHTHTWRCNHATGSEREYVENAIAGGLKILGFSDHTPMLYPDGFRCKNRMLPAQMDGYVDTVLALREEYAKDITIYLGLEAEYYPGLFDKWLDFLKDYPLDYLIMGQHWLGDQIGEPASSQETKDPEILKRYCAQVLEGLGKGCYSYLAHPDMIHFTGDSEVYKSTMYEFCKQIKKMQIPIEINFLGIWEHRNYPDPRFWKIAGEVGNTVIFGSDAHQKTKVWNPEALAAAEQMCRDYHLTTVDTLKFRPIN